MKKAKLYKNKYETFKKEKLIIINIFILLIIILYYTSCLPNKIKQPPKISKNTFNEIVSYMNINSNISLDEIYSFRQLNIQKKFTDFNHYFQKSENPIITVIVTMHNQAHLIHTCLRSIQNQSIKNLEILIIDDCSTDNSTETINEFQKEDPRIVLFTHIMNEGKIKSRTDGVRLAKGTYITIIDGDDSFAHEDILKHALFIAQKGNLDVVEFQEAYIINKQFKLVSNDYTLLNLTNIVFQPELSTKFFIISDNEGIRAIQSRSICAKLIKNEVFKETLKFIGTKYTEDFILEYEDNIMYVGLT